MSRKPELSDAAQEPPDEEMQAGWDAFVTSVQRPGAQARLKALIEQGLQQPGDLESNLNQYTARYVD